MRNLSAVPKICSNRPSQQLQSETKVTFNKEKSQRGKKSGQCVYFVCLSRLPRVKGDLLFAWSFCFFVFHKQITVANGTFPFSFPSHAFSYCRDKICFILSLLFLVIGDGNEQVEVQLSLTLPVMW